MAGHDDAWLRGHPGGGGGGAFPALTPLDDNETLAALSASKTRFWHLPNYIHRGKICPFSEINVSYTIKFTWSVSIHWTR